MKHRFAVALLALLSWSLLAAPPTFPLKVSENCRHLADSAGHPFFVVGDTPWFVQKLKGPVTVRWFDPTDDRSQVLERRPFATAGKRDFKPPAQNSAGESDWVLLLAVTP